MANLWTDAEYTALIDTIGDDVPMDVVLQAVQAVATSDSIPRTLNAIRKKARDVDLGLNYSGSDRDGKFHIGVSRRHHVKEEDESVITIVGEPRVAPTTQEPTTASETITTESDAIVAENSSRHKPMNGLIAYQKARKMLIQHKLRPDHEMVYTLSSYILAESDVA